MCTPRISYEVPSVVPDHPRAHETWGATPAARMHCACKLELFAKDYTTGIHHFPMDTTHVHGPVMVACL